MNDSAIRLYILMRNDLASMSPGRACAQASHASNHCVAELRKNPDYESGWFQTMLDTWEQSTKQHFGTAIVLAVSNNELSKIWASLALNTASSDNLAFGITHDPSYAVKDGLTTHYIPLDTCGWIFGWGEEIKSFVSHLPLY